MNRKILIYGAVIITIIAAVVTTILHRQKPVGLSTGTPASLSHEKSSVSEVEDIRINLYREVMPFT